MKTKEILILFFCLCFINSSFGQATIEYQVNIENCHHHELRISVTFPALPNGVLTVNMPKASPGRYAVHNFAKNVYAIEAFDGTGKSLDVYRTSPEQWQIAGHNGTVRFDYTLYANHADGTYSGIDNRKLHLNMPATFVYAEQLEDRPIVLRFDLNNKDWKVATQLEAIDASTFRAPNYYYFYDSPTIVGDIQFREWKSKSNGKNYTIQVAMMHEGTAEELDKYVEWVKRIVEEQKSIYGSLPDFDFGRYTFLLSYNPWVDGDGMEHRNSTICTSTGNLEQHAEQLIGTVSHEFFHAWNVERIRPKSLEPFDFNHANLSGELWFAEGFTSYYDDLVLRRSNIISPKDYAEGLSGTLSYVLNYPGRKIHSPIQMSYQAPFTDAATSIDDYNNSNIFISYYSYGAVIGLCLDLSIRKNFKQKSLDDLMQYLWEKFGKTEIPYQIADLEAALAAVTGDKDFATNFFSKYIYNSALPDVKDLLAEFGLSLDYKLPGKIGFLDGNMKKVEEGFRLNSKTLKGFPLYEAGMNKGDIIISLAGQDLSKVEEFKPFVETLEIGKAYPLKYLQNDLLVESQIVLEQHPALQCTLLEEKEEKVKKRVLKRRSAWLKE